MDTKLQRRQFGKRLTEAREAKGLTLSAFARAVKVAPPTALGWERGDYSPSAGSLRRIAGALDVTVDALLIHDRAA
ncbi:MAG: helix-turn-helix transcriptional regulator [Kofleriaceae bacterium]|nr:helix-turn-helix transcriptional regulator [Kofleriaceae bacterium]